MYYFLTVVFMLISAKGCFLYFYDIFYYGIDLVLIWYGLKFNRIKKSDIRILIRFAIVFVAFMIFRYLFLNQLPIKSLLMDLNFLCKYIFLSFLFCSVLKEKSIDYIVKLTIIGAGISLVFFAIQLISPKLLFAFFSYNPLPPRSLNPNYSNLLLYTFDKFHPTQNAGFSWEPGAFGCFLNIGLLLYFYSNKFVFNKQALVLVVAILTTFSTTSYMALAVNLLLYYRGKKGKFSIVFFIAIPVLLIVVFNVPFLFDKVVRLYDQDIQDLENIPFLSTYYLRHGGELPLNRFGSIIYIYQLFGEKLLWGISNSYSIVFAEMSNINICSGLMDFVAKFGLVGLLYFLYKYAKLFKKMIHNNELTFYAILILLILSFGEPILIGPNLLVFIWLNKYINLVDKNEVPKDLYSSNITAK